MQYFEWQKADVYAAPTHVRMELETLYNGNISIMFYGSDSLKIGWALIRSYFGHCFEKLREKFTPLSSK